MNACDAARRWRSSARNNNAKPVARAITAAGRAGCCIVGCHNTEQHQHRPALKTDEKLQEPGCFPATATTAASSRRPAASFLHLLAATNIGHLVMIQYKRWRRKTPHRPEKRLHESEAKKIPPKPGTGRYATPPRPPRPAQLSLAARRSGPHRMAHGVVDRDAPRDRTQVHPAPDGPALEHPRLAALLRLVRGRQRGRRPQRGERDAVADHHERRGLERLGSGREVKVAQGGEDAALAGRRACARGGARRAIGAGSAGGSRCSAAPYAFLMACVARGPHRARRRRRGWWRAARLQQGTR